MKNTVLFSLILLFAACSPSTDSIGQTTDPTYPSEDSLSAVERHYLEYQSVEGTSISSGTVSNGKLVNGCILPFSGNNFHYFDTTSYLKNRCFVNGRVRDALLETYRRLETITPERSYGIMECSNEHGGKISPHRTHQNGLSVDFMSPLMKNDQPYMEADFKGAPHYLMDFDENGRYTEDPSIQIDFETMARHLLVLIEAAKAQGLIIEKIIWKTELRDELLATESGKKLRATGVYITTRLEPLINALHDDHYHVDFRIGK
jgi:penicillin-insensitive murein endopeptidase